jgi:hypothetical protein
MHPCCARKRAASQEFMQPEISVAMTLPVGITIAKATMASRFSISFSFFTDMYRLSHFDYLISQCKCVVGIL